MITAADIAYVVGCHPVTVSAVLYGRQHRCSPELVARVRATAVALGYRPRTAPPDLPGIPGDEARAGQLLGRFSWVVPQPCGGVGDWLPDPNGTHDAYIVDGNAYLAEVQP